jgi:hypothetical protein|nr:MAG TPA: hypothetical protein [Caudoviricetes sp.]
MKRIGNLYHTIISVENLREADRKARKGKTHTYGVRVHDKNREANILALHEALLTKTFKTSPHDVFTIFEPKERLIFRLPYYPDRIVHHAIMNVLEPIWVKTFTYNTYSCIKKRGIEGCARQVDKIIREFEGKPLYCLKIDIKKYYPSISHNVMKRLIRRKIKDADLLWLLDEIIDSAQGLPIGNYLSQYLANLNLCYFMHWVNECLPELVRMALKLKEKPHIEAVEYADDIPFFAESKDVLHQVFKFIKGYIEEELELNIKSNYQIFPIAKNRYDRSGRALDYVGYKFYRNQKLIRKSIKKNFCHTVSRLNRRKPPLDAKAYKQAVASWLGWAKHSDSKHLLKTIIKPCYYDSIL